MNTKLVQLDPEQIDLSALQEAADLIRSGSLVAFPTETVYGLGASALNALACDHIFEAKGRPHDNPLIVHVEKPEECYNYAYCEEYPVFEKIAARFMPGPITVIMRKKSVIPDTVTVGLDTVALRCPIHPVARALIRLSGVPIAAPSANRSGKPSPTTAKHVLEDMDGRIPMILDGGPCKVGLESTVISLKDDGIHLLRPGAITKEMLMEFGEDVHVSDAVLSSVSSNQKVESPGMKYRHYAPQAPCTMVDGDDDAVRSFFQEKLKEGCGVLCFEEDLPYLDRSSFAVSLGKQDDITAQAHDLFYALRRFDEWKVTHIYVRKTSESSLGLALTNRLLRACAFDVIKL